MMGIEAMKNVSPKTVDRSTLVQRSSIRLDPAAPREDRLREFIKQIRNPYCYLDGKTVVKISFTETDTTMEDLSKPDNELPVTPMMEAFEAAYKKHRTKNGKRA